MNYTDSRKRPNPARPTAVEIEEQAARGARQFSTKEEHWAYMVGYRDGAQYVKKAIKAENER